MDFVIKIRELTDSLSSTGDLVSDRDKIEFVAEGLGPDFQPFILSTHNQHNMLVENFIPLVFHKDRFLCKQSSPFSTNQAPFAANLQNSSRDNRCCNNNRSYKNRFWSTEPYEALNHMTFCLITWLLDFGALNHMTPEIENLSDAREYSGNKSITIGHGLTLPISHIGKIK